MIIKSAFLTFLIVTMISCNDRSENKSEDDESYNGELSKETKQFLDLEEQIIAEDPLAEIKFDKDGKKWKADSETQDGMFKIKDILDHFEGENFIDLGAQINDELQSIISLCDMTGEAHKQYHIVLNAMLKISKEMMSGTSSDLENLKYCTYTYFEYFEL